MVTSKLEDVLTIVIGLIWLLAVANLHELPQKPWPQEAILWIIILGLSVGGICLVFQGIWNFFKKVLDATKIRNDT